jgi:hypothetical protein
MAGLPDLVAIVGETAGRHRLERRQDISEPGWAFWELRNLNMHRVVGVWRADTMPASPAELDDSIRGAIARNFHRSWWRGLAFGVVVVLPTVPWSPDDLRAIVDIRENRHGVLQWAVIATHDGRAAVGVHTWELVFLSPLYRDVTAALTAAGCQVTRAVKGKDGLMQLLTTVSSWQGTTFPEYRDPS